MFEIANSCERHLIFKLDILFHLAAQPLVELSYTQPEETFSTNIMGLISVLEAAKSCPNLKVIVNVTSDKCYRPQVQFMDIVNVIVWEEMTLTARAKRVRNWFRLHIKNHFLKSGQTLVTARAETLLAVEIGQGAFDTRYFTLS